MKWLSSRCRCAGSLLLLWIFAASPAEAQQPVSPPALETLTAIKDFKVELLYTVPRATQGSWVNMCVGPDNRLIVSDQGGAGLFRITPPAIGGKAEDIKVEKMPAQISGANGLVWAYDSLYVVVCGGGGGRRGGMARPNGLYRVRASTPGGELDQVEQLRTLQGGGDHGPHAVMPGPDGKSLFVVAGNDTRLTQLSGSYVPRLWQEDLLFPIVASFSSVVPPAGCIYKVDADGKNWELWSAGYRNHYDAAFNRHGELFTYDSDMEWDMNTPWYRPTRVYLATSGSDFGFRNGSNNSPDRLPEVLPAVVDIGPGSPTGVTFGYGAKFPAKYQDALFLCDWSYGRLFAVHLTPDGSAYRGQAEEFVTGTPLPIADAVVNPKDGALYFVTGGRNTQSKLYRVTYTGSESTEPAKVDDTGAEARALRRKLEAFHNKADAAAVETAWPYLSHEDRYVRYAARVAIEHQDIATWRERALKETNSTAAIQSLLALTRVASVKDATDEVAAKTLAEILPALEKLDWAKLDATQKNDLLRVYTVLLARYGKPDNVARESLVKRLDAIYPTTTYELNADLCQLLVYLDSANVVGKTLPLIAKAATQEEQMEYVKSLRNLKTGWTMAQRKEFFEWFVKAATYKGGQRFAQYVTEIKRTAVANLSTEEAAELKPVLDARPAPMTEVATTRPVVKQWKLEELTALTEKGLTGRNYDRGRTLFAEARCFACHRYQNEGGTGGPDLTQAAGRFSVRDLLDSIVDPNKVISDQYAASVFSLDDGRTIVGRVVNMNNTNMSVLTDMQSPAGSLRNINVNSVESITPSKVSMMPAGLLDTLQEDEVLDLMAYLLSRGDRNSKLFVK